MKEERYHLALDAYDKNIVYPCFKHLAEHSKYRRNAPPTLWMN